MVSQHRATSHFSHIIETFLVTPLAEHARHLRVADGIGQCFLSRSSSLKKNVAIQNGQVKQMEEEFLYPLPCATVDRIRIRHSISLIYITHVAVSVNHHS